MKILRTRTRLWNRIASIALKRIGLNVPNDPDRNGEVKLIRWLAQHPAIGPHHTVFDIGANTGAYMNRLWDAFPPATSYYAFEPSSVAYGQLARRFDGVPECTLERLACSDRCDTAVLYFDVPGSSQGSLHRRNLAHVGTTVGQNESVQMIRLADYCEQRNIDWIDFLKIDVEGHELSVLRGAEEMIDTGRIAAIQLEMGGTDVDSRTFLRDFWEYLHDRYDFYRLTARGLSPIRDYAESQEHFVYQNLFLRLSSRPM